MMRSKKDVDRHVRDIMGKVKSDNERKLRGYNIARLYHNVQEYDSARRYLSEFLSVRPKSIDGHRLSGQILEASGNKEKAVLAYKTAYDLGDGQKDLLVKICELYTSVSCDLSVKMHWADLGQQKCPHHEAVTKLRSSIISHSTETKSREKLQELYLDEIKVNPTSAELQSNLLKLYLDWSQDVPDKLLTAYNYMAEVETRRPFSHSLLWYQTVLQVCQAYDKKGPDNCNNCSFSCLYLTCLERLLQLTLEVATAPNSEKSSNSEPYMTQAANLLLKLDSRMYAMKSVDKHFEEGMAGQLFLHLAQYLMITAKKFTSSVSPNTILCLLLHSCRYQLPPSKGEHVHLHRLACYRLSQSCHIISSTAKDSGTSISSLVSKVKQQCSNVETMQEVFKAVFGQRSFKSSSYFMDKTDFVTSELTYPDLDAAVYDQVVCASEGSDLREIVWLYMQQLVDESKESAAAPISLLNLSLTSTPSTRSNNTNSITTAVKDILKKAQPLFPYRIFEGLQFGCSHVSSMLPDSLCHLDLLGFLAATVYCVLDSGVCASNVRSIVCKASVCNSWLLHSQEQGEWWTAAHALHYSAYRKVPLSKSASKYRNVVQKGLSSLRLLGSSSLPLAVHLARCYSSWASSSSDSFSISEVMSLEERAEHLWHKVLSIIKKVKGGVNVLHHTPTHKIFSISRQELSEAELEEAEEEGNFFLAKRLIKCGRRQEALQALGQLKSPDASFQRAMLYKHQAGEMLAAVNDDVSLLSPEQRNQHSLLLSQMRDTLYLTYDRLRAPGVDRNHPLNAELGPELSNVECLLTSLPTVQTKGNDTSILATEPLSPINELHDLSSHDLSNGHNGSIDTTPLRSGSRSMQTSTIRRLEARPSPERLDAQVRHLTTVQEQTLQNLREQNSALRCHNNTLKDFCSTLSLQVKENTTLFRSILEQNKTVSMECYNNLLAEVKTILPAIKELKEGVKKLEADQQAAQQAAPSVPPHHLPLYYGGYYGSAQAHPPPGGLHSHHPHPPVSSIPGHNLQTPQSPAAYLHPTEQGYPSSSVGSSYHLSRLLSGGTSTPHHSTSTNSAGALVSTTEAAMAAQQAYFQSVSSQQQYSTENNVNAPHDYQIALPPHSVIPPPTPPSHNTPERQPPMPVKGLLANVPAPLYSAVTPENSPLRPLNVGNITAPGLGGIAPPTSVQGGVSSVFGSGSHSTPSALTAALTGKVKSFSTNSPAIPSPLPASSSVVADSPGDDYYKNDDDHDPCPDYKPVVPLPEEVVVLTGEEQEEVLFEERAKLFRMVAKEWKERGTGVIKILHHSTNYTVRVLMRREKTHKICANHQITSNMELKKQQSSETAWLWAAQDFADEELKTETFCCKFKTPEIASSFHSAFVKANKLAAEFEKSPATEKTPAVTSSVADSTKPLSELFKKAEGSWNCTTCLVDNKPDSNNCVACQTPNPAAPVDTTKETSSASTFGFGSASTFSFGLSGSTTKAPGGSITFGLSSSSLAATKTTSSSVFGSISSTPTTSSLFGKMGSSVTITPVASAGDSIFGSTGGSTPQNTNISKSIFATPEGQNSSVSSPSVFVTPVSSFGSAATTSAPLTFGGFSFTTTPSIVPPKTEVKQEEAKPEEKKLGLFSSFSFGTPKTSTAPSSGGGLFSGSSGAAGGLTFSGFSPNANTTPESVFKTKNTDAFKPKPLFGGNTSQVTPKVDDSADHVEEYEPEVHFEPVIPLPDLVQVKTGEEEEETLFCERAKLFRWAGETKEWKERGLGDVKILSNKDTNKIRIVMRREKTLKICANHYITPDLSLKVKDDCDKAITWAACDFSEGEIIKEKFTIRFKSVDLANSFKAAVEKERDSLGKTVATVEKVAPKVDESKSLMDKFKPAAGSWECDTCLLRNTPDCTECASCKTVKPGCEAPTKSTPETGGFTAKPFSFGSSSTASFSFGVTPSSSNVEGKPPLPTFSQTVATASEKSAFKFGSPDKFEFSFKPKTPPPATSVSRSRDVSQCESEDGAVDEDEGDHIYFEPVIPLPDKVDVVTGEEGEQELYCHRAKLFRLIGSEWKERGLGNVKLMLNLATKKVRLLMRREQIHKICLNHYVSNDMVFKSKDDKSLYWVAQDFSEGEAVKETFCIRFKTPEICLEFKESIERVQKGDFSVSITVEESADGNQTDLAKKLLLPPDFFSSASECSGCIGCKVDSLPPFLALQTPEDNILVDSKPFSDGDKISSSQKSLFDKKEGASSKVTNESTSSSGSIFGGAKVTEASGSIFSGLKATTVSSGSIFGGSSQSTGIFGGASTTPSSGSIFGGATAKPTTQSVFGGAAATSSSTGSIFGGVGTTTPASGSIFGGAGTTTPASGSIFGGAGATKPTSGSMFGGAGATTPTSGSIFGGAGTTTPATGSMFGGASAATPSSGSMFGGASAATPASGSMFGGAGATTPASGSMFGGAGTTTPASGSIFGGAGTTTPASGSMFGGAGTTTPASGSMFGGAGTTSLSSGSIFGGASNTTQAGSIFGGAASTPSSGSKTTPSLFGGASNKTNGADGMLSFGAMKDTSSATGFLSKDNSFNASAWQAKPAFSTKTIAKINSSTNESQNESDLVEEDDHDPHFEPVVPLPELVVVKTGEEDFIELFCCRSKVYRYDSKNKEWKERGLGNIKIYLDPINKNFRILQRREQVHKLSVNHYIVRGQKLTPLSGSDVSWCWFAQDFSDSSSGVSEQFAAKFKTAEMAGEFKCKFEECIDVVENPELMNSFITAHGGIVRDMPEVVHDDEDYEDESTSDDTEDDDDYVESDVMYESRVHLEKRIGESWEVLGEEVTLRLVWESDVDGTRMMATGEGEGLLLDHLMTADMNYQIDDNMVSWSALDLNPKPACQVKLRIKFKSDIETHQFLESFDEAKSIANLETTDAHQFNSCDPKLTEELSKILPPKGED